MAQVSVTINGRVYRVGCDEGQEQMLAGLAEDLDQRIDGFRTNFGEVGDMRLLIMAALEVSDELTELRKRLAACERELEELRGARSEVAGQVTAAQDAIAETLEAAAARVERLTATLRAAAPRS